MMFLATRVWSCFAWCMAATVLILCSWSKAQAAPRYEAFVGEPFGVGRVTVDVFRGEPTLPLSDERFTAIEENGRVVYPVLKQEPVRRILRRVLQIETPSKVTLYFLFRGDQPFDLSVFSPVEQAVRVKPQKDNSAHQRLLAEWWQQYAGRWRRLLRDPQFPPVAENFLVATLSRRLGLPLPQVTGGLLPWNKKKESVWDELLVSESHQLSIDREMLQRNGQPQPERHALPEPLTWSEPELAKNDLDKIDVEPMAQHVPQECFYLRFGTFTNYLWFRDLNAKWQGDLKNMILRRGIDREASRRIQQQLSLRETLLAKVLGPQVIADVAIVGLDPYLEQGAAIGILFQAKSNQLLAGDLMSKRREALAKFASATESTVPIAGHDVSLIATPDGQVRSYYAQDGDFHLVSTSRTLVERFLQAGQGGRSLAKLASFRHARERLPLDRKDAVFAFASGEFFQNLCSPQVRIETRRRLQSVKESQLLELARLAAAAEGRPNATRAELIDAHILPTAFASRYDGSQLEETHEGSLDTLRGAPGYFVPVADMQVTEVTTDEAAAYRRFTERFRAEVGQMASIAAAIHRTPRQDSGGETMSIDLLLAPLGEMKLGSVAGMLSEPSNQQLRPVEGDVMAMQAVLDIPVPLAGGESQPHHLFGGLRDFRSPLAVRQGTLVPDATPTELIRGYLGAWPRPGLLEAILGPMRPSGNEPEQVGQQMWQAKQDDFFLLSFKPEVIQQVLPQLALEPAERPAQVRLRIDDLTGKQLAATVNALGYMRARETSVAASRLMNTLANQLHVPPDACRALAERLVDGKFVCALGGKYQLVESQPGMQVWTSSALPPRNRFLLTEVPEDFQLPLLTWFRGLQGDLKLADGSLTVHLEIEMTADAVP